jgi:hypothetical protein
MSNLFKKAAVFTDIHFGLKSNSLQHNQDCLEMNSLNPSWSRQGSGGVSVTYEE